MFNIVLTFCNCFNPSSVFTHACSTLKSILSSTVPLKRNKRTYCYDHIMMITIVKTWRFFPHLFHHHSGQISKDLIEVWDGLDDLSDLPLALLHHNRVLFHQHQLIVRETLQAESVSVKSCQSLWYVCIMCITNYASTCWGPEFVHDVVLSSNQIWIKYLQIFDACNN